MLAQPVEAGDRGEGRGEREGRAPKVIARSRAKHDDVANSSLCADAAAAG